MALGVLGELGGEFAGLTRSLHIGPESTVAMLKAYFDDTGAAEQAVGGCLASEQSWEKLDLAWGAALDEAGLKWFHAKDFENYRHKDYAHLLQVNRDALFTRLLALVLGGHLKTGHTWTGQNRP
jgi:hypothetical protein